MEENQAGAPKNHLPLKNCAELVKMDRWIKITPAVATGTSASKGVGGTGHKRRSKGGKKQKDGAKMAGAGTPTSAKPPTGAGLVQSRLSFGSPVAAAAVKATDSSSSGGGSGRKRAAAPKPRETKPKKSR